MFGAVKLTKNNDLEKYRYSGYGIGFDSEGPFVFPNGEFACNVIIFGTDMSSPVHADNSKKDILILGEDPRQGLDGATLTAEKIYSITFTKSRNKLCLTLHYNGANSYLFVNGIEIIKFKANDFEIVATALCLGYISKTFTADNMKKKTGLYGFVYDFIDYGAIAELIYETFTSI